MHVKLISSYLLVPRAARAQNGSPFRREIQTETLAPGCLVHQPVPFPLSALKLYAKADHLLVFPLYVYRCWPANVFRIFSFSCTHRPRIRDASGTPGIIYLASPRQFVAIERGQSNTITLTVWKDLHGRVHSSRSFALISVFAIVTRWPAHLGLESSRINSQRVEEIATKRSDKPVATTRASLCNLLPVHSRRQLFPYPPQSRARLKYECIPTRPELISRRTL